MRNVKAMLPVMAVILLCMTAPALAGEIITQRTFTLDSEVLAEQRTVRVHLPAGYDETGSSYHVLYLLDADWDEFWDAAMATVAHDAAVEGIPPLIMVGLHNTVRNRDMIPAAVNHRPGSGGSEAFLRFITTELLPHIDEHYTTNNRNVLYGGSNAGLFTVYALLTAPEAFIGAIASSPMIGHCAGFMDETAGNLEDADRYTDRSLYMIYGEDDFERCTGYVADFLARIRGFDALRCELVMLPGEGHVPAPSLERGLRYLFTGVP